MLACSALKQSYREELLAGRPSARMVFLHVTRAVLEARLRARHGHFFPAALLDSQLADLESPQPAEHVLVVEATLPAGRSRGRDRPAPPAESPAGEEQENMSP